MAVGVIGGAVGADGGPSLPGDPQDQAANATIGRRRRWAPARDALWTVLDPLLAPGASIGIVGAGNGDDFPLARIAARAGRIDLLDTDLPP